MKYKRMSTWILLARIKLAQYFGISNNNLHSFLLFYSCARVLHLFSLHYCIIHIFITIGKCISCIILTLIFFQSFRIHPTRPVRPAPVLLGPSLPPVILGPTLPWWRHRNASGWAGEVDNFSNVRKPAFDLLIHPSASPPPHKATHTCELTANYVRFPLVWALRRYQHQL